VEIKLENIGEVNYLFRLLIVRKRKWIFSSLLVLLLAAVAGCQSIGYYKQAFSGQMEMLSNKQPIPELIENANTSPKLKEKFQLVLALRNFAETKLHLPAGKQYLSYVDLHRSNVVWNVYAAPELSLKPTSWWFPIVGSVTYRGYFSEPAAMNYAEKMKKKGLDVYVGGVDAYSTLGWFNDPVLNTFIGDSERRLASLIFHELAHQCVFFSGDTEFNEAFATAVAEEGLRRWLVEKNDPAALKKYQVELTRKKQFVDLITDARNHLKKVYGDFELKTNRTISVLTDAQKRAEKKLILEKLRADFAKLKIQWGGFEGYDEWFEGPLNNAQLNTVATYYDLVPAFHELIEENGGDLNKFYAQMKKLSFTSKEKRHQTLAKVILSGRDDFFAAPNSHSKGANLPMSAAAPLRQSPAVFAR
jgi:predicted aminopeptidase